MEQPLYNEVADQVGLHGQVSQANAITQQSNQQQYYLEKQEKNLAEAQLECEKTLENIYHLLRQDVLKPREGIMEWTPIDNERKRVLTDEGVDKIMQVMKFYINKETLLSNFNDKQIPVRMLKFCLALNANIFMKYEIYFRVPTLEECQSILQSRILDKVKMKKMAYEITNQEFDEEEIKKVILKEMEDKIEYELTKIKSEQIKINLREYELIFTQLEALVDATHNRAWKGEERGSLRRHFNISEVIGGKPPGMNQSNGWFGWGGKR